MARNSENSKEQNWNVKLDEPSKKARTKKSVKEKKPRSNPKWIKVMTSFFESEKSSRIFGLTILLTATFLLLSFSSYFFTGREDFDQIQNHNFLDFLFNSEIDVENWLGNLGAAVSHFFIFKGFGISSLVIPFLLFLIGFKMLFGFSILSLKKSFKHSFFYLIWVSLSLGLIFYEGSDKFLYGQFGYQMDTWIFRVIGKIGAFFILAIALFTYLVIAFNFSFQNFFAFFNTKSTLTEDEIAENAAALTNKDLELETTEVIDVAKEIETDTENDAPIDSDLTLEVEEKKINEENNGPNTEGSGTPGDVEFLIEKTEEDVLSEKDVNEAFKNFGPYDPTLDLPKYQVPTLDLLEDHGSDKLGVDKEELEENKNKIVSSLENYNIRIQSIKATIGPTVTLYEIIPEAGIRISKIKNLEDDIALSLAALGIRIIAPIPGKGTIGIEVPNKNPEVVSMRSVLSSSKFQE